MSHNSLLHPNILEAHAVHRTMTDLMELKLQKRLVQEKLNINRSTILKLSEQLREKEENKKKLGLALPASETTLTLNGTYRVDDFRLPPHQRKAVRVASKPFNHEDVEPTPTTDPQMLRIRLENIRRTTCKRQVQRIIKNKEDVIAAKAYRESRKVRILPKLNVPASMLPHRYERGELPCTIEHGLSGHFLSWAAPLDNLDYEYYLPMFFDGLQCKENPSRFISRQGIDDLLYASKGYPDRIIPCIKNLVRPIRNALSKFDVDILLGVLHALELLINCNDGIGLAILPFSKQFLAPIASFMDMNKNIGDSIDYGQRNDNDVGENVRKVLELLEEKGGNGAFEAIKFSIPLYQSCMRNPAAHHHKKALAAEGDGFGSRKGGH